MAESLGTQRSIKKQMRQNNNNQKKIISAWLRSQELPSPC